MQDKNTEEVTISAAQILFAPIIFIACLCILLFSYEALYKRDIDSGSLMFFGSVFMSIGASFAYKSLKFITYFSLISFALNMICLFLALKNENKTVMATLIISVILIYTFYYLGRTRALKHQ